MTDVRVPVVSDLPPIHQSTKLFSIKDHNMITQSRLRRFQAALLTLLDPMTAVMIGTLAAAKMEAALPGEAPEKVQIIINGEGVDLDLFAAEGNQSRREAYADLVQANQKARSALGFDLFDDIRSRRGDHDPARGSVIALSLTFQSLLDGTAMTAQSSEEQAGTRPDVATRKGLDIIAASAASEAGSRFLWRIAASPDSASARLELTRLATKLKGVAGGASVLVGGHGMRAEKAASDLPSIALASLLHADPGAVLILARPSPQSG